MTRKNMLLSLSASLATLAMAAPSEATVTVQANHSLVFKGSSVTFTATSTRQDVWCAVFTFPPTE
jgi:hypothetical protein